MHRQQKTRLNIDLIISMQNIVDFLNSAINNYCIDRSTIINEQGRLNKEMKVDGWISLILNNRECVVLKFRKGYS